MPESFMVKKGSSAWAAVRMGPPKIMSITANATYSVRNHTYVMIQYARSCSPCSFIISRIRCSRSSTSWVRYTGRNICSSHM